MSETGLWVTGGQSGLAIPADPAALESSGAAFLTNAFHASGVLARSNAVAGITGFREIPGGSTGRKVAMSVTYLEPQPGLHTDLFVKFSRDFDNPARDRGKIQMGPEVRYCGGWPQRVTMLRCVTGTLTSTTPGSGVTAMVLCIAA